MQVDVLTLRYDPARGVLDSSELHAFQQFARAVELLSEVVVGQWDGRFPQIEVIAVMEANRIIGRAKSLGLKTKWQPALDGRLVKLLDEDIRIVMTWDTDQTDIDLWIIEPSGEKCFYSHPRTTIGGLMTKDFTGGYGPEEYNIRNAMPGRYTVMANFYGSSQQRLTGGTTVQATIITNYGRPNEKRQAITLRLTQNKEVIDIGTITFGSTADKK